MQQVFVLGANQNRLPGASVCSWDLDLDLEFLDAGTGTSVTANTTRIDWARPRFRLYPRGGAGIIPAFAARPGAVACAPNVWHGIEINYV